MSVINVQVDAEHNHTGPQINCENAKNIRSKVEFICCKVSEKASL